VSLNNTPDVQNYASTLFTFVHAGSLSIIAGFAHLIAQEEKQLVDSDQVIRFRKIRTRPTILTLVVLFSLAVPWDWFLLGIHVRLLIWFAPIISFWVNRMSGNPPLGGPSHPSPSKQI